MLTVALLGGASTGVAAIAYAVPYATTENSQYPTGTVVVLEGDSVVRPARQGEGQRTLGSVAALPERSLAPGKVGVASSGVVSVLATDIGGVIKRGDRLTISPIEGVVMKATSSSWIIGTAQADLTTDVRAATQEVTGTDGRKVQASIKEIPLLFAVSYYSAESADAPLGSVQRVVEAVAGHKVSTERAILAVAIFALAMILLVTLVASAVKHSLIAIGRNPMANGKIARSLARVLLTAFGVIVVTLAVIYLLLQ